jgi:flavin reductase (DIM6/NTAB) family NADH-FMN oxidoreductase RutF
MEVFMSLQAIGAVNGLYPSLTTIVGSIVDGRPNWMAVAHVGIMNHAIGDVPQYLGISVHPSHHTNLGIREHGQFSINVPSRAMLEVTDYVGIVSGRSTDKSELFEVFQGGLEFAPMIAQCPLTMECRVRQTVIVGEHELFIGELVQTYARPECLTDGKIDLGKVDPLLFDFTRILYWSLGDVAGKPWNAGKALKKARP